jgi:hypothetical protein
MAGNVIGGNHSSFFVLFLSCDKQVRLISQVK